MKKFLVLVLLFSFLNAKEVINNWIYGNDNKNIVAAMLTPTKFDKNKLPNMVLSLICSKSKLMPKLAFLYLPNTKISKNDFLMVSFDNQKEIKLDKFVPKMGFILPSEFLYGSKNLKVTFKKEVENFDLNGIDKINQKMKQDCK